MATAAIPQQFAGQAPAHYGYTAPPSPPMDDASRCSLPSISNLLDLADQGSPTSDHFPASQQQQQQQQQQPSASAKAESRPDSSHFVNGAVLNAARAVFPPTPPMSTDAAFEGYGSPSTKSISQVSMVSNRFSVEPTAPPMSQMDADFQRQQAQQQMAIAAPQPPRISALQASTYQPSFVTSNYIAQPTMTFFPPAMQSTPPPQPQISSLFYQRPLPQTFPPLPVSMSLGQAGPNPWQHHHYISPSTAASFPQSQDRYICQTCNKAFSRPSSLRIHSHSHTGEKPFRCAHPGCGKAFSVRSNMKRHERGCHSFESSGSGSALL